MAVAPGRLPMVIQVKLFAMLEDHLPPGGEDNTARLDLPEGTTARQVVERLKIPLSMATLSMVDGVHLTPDEFQQRPLRAGETLAIFPPIAGG